MHFRRCGDGCQRDSLPFRGVLLELRRLDYLTRSTYGSGHDSQQAYAVSTVDCVRYQRGAVDFCAKEVVQRKCVGDQRRISSTCRSEVQGQARAERM